MRNGVLCGARRRLRARGLDRAPGARDRRLGVPLQPAAARRPNPRHRGDPVRRDRRHDRADPLCPRAWLPDHRRHEHRRIGDHPRGGRGPLPAGRPGDRRRRLEDLRDPGDHARGPRRGDRTAARHDERGRRARARGGAPGASRGGRAGDRLERSRGRATWHAGTSTRAASCSSAAARPTRPPSRAR